MSPQYNGSEMVLFACQMLIIFTVVIVSLINLTFEWGSKNLWIILLTSCLGYILPNPKLKPSKKEEQSS